MELKEVLKTIKKNLFILSSFAILGSALGLTYGLKSSGQSKMEQLAFIPSKEATRESDPYAGYWAQEKARNFTDTAVAILASSQFSNEHLKTQGEITIRKSAPQVIKITTVAQTEEQANNLISEAISGFNQEINTLSPGESYRLVALTNLPQKAFSGPTKVATVAAGAVFGVVFAAFVIGLARYLKL